MEINLEHDRTSREKLLESNAFEVWLEGTQCVWYHMRAETNVEMTDEHIEDILEDIAFRVSDEAILWPSVHYVPPFPVPGYSREDHIEKLTQYV